MVAGLDLLLVSGLVVQFWVSVDFRFLVEFVVGVVGVACMVSVVFRVWLGVLGFWLVPQGDLGFRAFLFCGLCGIDFGLFVGLIVCWFLGVCG